RELRAAAALARFGQQKEEQIKKEEEQDSGSETESDYENPGTKQEAVDLDGSKMLDGNGHGMVKVCRDEDKGSIDVQKEIRELQELNDSAPSGSFHIKQEDVSTASEDETEDNTAQKTPVQSSSTSSKAEHSDRRDKSSVAAVKSAETEPNPEGPLAASEDTDIACPIKSQITGAAGVWHVMEVSTLMQVTAGFVVSAARREPRMS
ncbi:MAG: hypothetical protein M1830_004686, partial [Pleopsidium flavum]